MCQVRVSRYGVCQRVQWQNCFRGKRGGPYGQPKCSKDSYLVVRDDFWLSWTTGQPLLRTLHLYRPNPPVAHLPEPPESAWLHVALFRTSWMLNDVMHRESAHARITGTASCFVWRQNKPMLSLNFSFVNNKIKPKICHYLFQQNKQNGGRRYIVIG